jgi:hypothetical protein
MSGSGVDPLPLLNREIFQDRPNLKKIAWLQCCCRRHTAKFFTRRRDGALNTSR